MIELRRPLAALVLTVLLASANIVLAQDHPSEHSGRPNGASQGAAGVLSLLPADSVTEHTIDLPSGKLAYTATAGTFSLFDQSGERSAAIFYTAFVAKSDNAAARPVTFVFNGGPGAASAFLNLGLVGPRIAEFGMDGPRRLEREADRQSGHLARLHRSRSDRSGRHRLEPRRQARRRQGVLGRRRRRAVDGQGHRALHRQERPRRVAEIHSRRELWRLPRRQGRARLAERSGHRDVGHSDAVAAPRRRVSVRRRPLRAWRGAATAFARRRQARARRQVQHRGAWRKRSISRSPTICRRLPGRRCKATPPKLSMRASPP